MSKFSEFDHVQARRETDAAVKAAAIREMMSRPKRNVFTDYKRLLADGQCATKSPTTVLVVDAQQPVPSKDAQRKVVVGLPAQPGGLRPVYVDGKLVGHAQRAPEEDRGWGEDWAYKAVAAEDLEYFESLAELRAHALSLPA